MIFVVIGIGVIAAIIWLSVLYSKKRKEELALVAKEMGFTYTSKSSSQIPNILGDLKLFKMGHYRRARDILEGTFGDTHWKIFNYSYTTGNGDDEMTFSQAVAYAELKEVALPEFFLSQENFFHKIGQAFGYKDINFPSHPDFSKRYLLRGPDEEKIRRIFNGSVLDFFEQEKDIFSVEAIDNRIVIYKPHKTIHPRSLPDFFQQAKHIARLISMRV